MIEKIIKYQNESEKNFESTKNASSIVNYIIAFILFILSSIIAGLTLPIRYIYKKLFKRNNTSKIIHLDGENFVKTLNSEQLILIDFWAEWCGPCVMMNAIIEKFAAESSHIKIAKVNADFNKKILEEYQIKGLPQFLLIKNGKEIKRFAGAMTYSDLSKFCNDTD